MKSILCVLKALNRLTRTDMAYWLSQQIFFFGAERWGHQVQEKMGLLFFFFLWLLGNDDRHIQNPDTNLALHLLLCCYGISMAEMPSPYGVWEPLWNHGLACSTHLRGWTSWYYCLNQKHTFWKRSALSSFLHLTFPKLRFQFPDPDGRGNLSNRVNLYRCKQFINNSNCLN